MLRLYHFALSPFSRKVRLCLAEKKIEVELVEEKYWEQSAEFLRRVIRSRIRIAQWAQEPPAILYENSGCVTICNQIT